MSICQRCQSKSERPCKYSDRTREFYDAMMPALQFVARRCGYALAVHGSLKTDIDLIAAPWRDSAVDAAYLAEQIRLTAERVIGTAEEREYDANPTRKPCGRLAWSFHLQPQGVEGPYIDLSVLPMGSHPQEEAKNEQPA